MRNRLIAYGIVFLTLLYTAYTLPKRLMLESYEYIGKYQYPHATYTGANKQHNPIVRLQLGGSDICTASIISDQYALTAAHCIRDGARIVENGYMLESDKRDAWAVGFVAFAYGIQDIAILFGDFSSFKYLPVDWSGSELNSKFGKTCGYPEGQKELLCSDYELLGNSFFYIRGNGHLFQGMSGGPLIVNGKILGVNSHVSFLTSMVGPVIGIQKIFEVFNGKN